MNNKKEKRYIRLYKQIDELLHKKSTPMARMSTIIALLHNKIDYFFWTGFYLLHEGDLFVACYQGLLACQKLEKHVGVCWAGIDSQETVVVPDVTKFPGHIACCDLSKSEIVVPLKDNNGVIVGVLDVDSKSLNSFDDIDKKYLEKIVELIYQ
ncbi:MAG: GAF domain-containing protein [Marinilabiliaceae bacterium]|nr:GAF domain-containing protein [Marinilabiliaceae bacterium]